MATKSDTCSQTQEYRGIGMYLEEHRFGAHRKTLAIPYNRIEHAFIGVRN